MTGVQISVQAKLDDSDVEKVVRELTDQLNRLGQGVTQANKIKYNPFTKAVLDDADKLEEKLKRILALHQAIAKVTPGVNVPSSPGTMPPIAPILPPAPSPAAPSSPTPAGVPPGSSPAQPGGRPGGVWWNNRFRNPFHHTMFGRVTHAALGAAGPVGGAVSGAMNSAYVGGKGSFMNSGAVTAGIGSLFGNLLAIGVSKAISSVTEKIGAAQNDMIGYDTLKRQLGDVGVSFEGLRAGLHASSDAIDVTYQEAQKLGTEFARLSSMTAKQSSQLADEVRVSGGFGRSFGMDPSQSVAFFAQMRQFGVTQNSGDSNKLGLSIAEAISRSGAFAKADEVLQAIASYTTQQTRLGLSTANVMGYAGEFSGLVGAHIPGLDVGGAANLLQRVNSSFANGGAAGAAGQNFMYMALGAHNGLNPIQTMLLQEQGAFGTGAGTFGKGSLYSRWSQANGMGGVGAAGSSSETNLAATMSRLRKMYSGSPDRNMLRIAAESRLFGVSTNQAMALDYVGPDKIGGLVNSMQANGIDFNKMSATGASSLAQIFTGGRGVLNEQARGLWGRLNGSESKTLQAASDSGDNEKLRSVLMQLTAKYGQEETEGDKTRKSIQDLDKDFTDAAGKLIPSINTMRDTLLYAFGNRGAMTADDMHKAVVDAQRKQVNQRADDRIAKARSQYTDSSVGSAMGAQTPSDLKAISDSYDNLQQVTKDANKERSAALAQIDAGETPAATASPGATNGLPMPASMQGDGGPTPSRPAPGKGGDLRNDPWLIQQLAETDRVDGLTPGTSYAQIMRESSFNPNATSKAGAMGLAQVIPKTLKSLEKQLGRKINPYDKADAVLIQRAVMAENMRRYHGNELYALSAYNGGTDPSKWGNPETSAYGPAIMQGAGMYAFGMPAGNGSGSPFANQAITFHHTVTLQDSKGNPIAAPSVVTKKVSAPQAAGAPGAN